MSRIKQLPFSLFVRRLIVQCKLRGNRLCSEHCPNTMAGVFALAPFYFLAFEMSPCEPVRKLPLRITVYPSAEDCTSLISINMHE